MRFEFKTVMVAIFITITACIYFFWEARKRHVSPWKWALIALAAFMGPQILVGWILLAVVLIAFEIPINDSSGIATIFAITGFIIGFWLLVVARKRLYKYRRIELPEDAIVLDSLDIIENDDGSFSVGDRKFKKRKDAEEFVEFTRSIRH